jgi:acyl-CoA thioesterase-1
VLGDSLSAEFGLQRGKGWVALMERRIADERIHATVINASISGDTTYGGRTRLPALLAKHQPQVLIIELGANDALRGMSQALTQENLIVMAQAAQKIGAKVIFLGMQLPPNYGPEYTKKFAETYPEAARITKSALVPFFLEDVANPPDIADAGKLFQSDNFHPNELAQPILLRNVWPIVRKTLP